MKNIYIPLLKIEENHLFLECVEGGKCSVQYNGILPISEIYSFRGFIVIEQ